MNYSQSDVVEFEFPLPNGQFKIHPAIIISSRDVLEIEGVYICVMLSTKDTNPEFIFEVQPKMLTYSSDKISYAKCQLITRIKPNAIIRRFGSIKSEYFKQLLSKLNLSVFSYHCNQ